MRTHDIAKLAVLILSGCGPGHVIRQTSVTQIRDQDALVMAPEAPMGFGTSLPAGSASLSLGAGLTAVQTMSGDDFGQKTLPLSGLMRGAVAAGQRVELTASGSLGSPDVELGPLARGVDGLDGVLGRGTLGMRMFVPIKGLVQWGWSIDAGAEATHLARTDTVTTTVKDRRNGSDSSEQSETYYRMRTLPHARLGSVLRVPVPGGVSMISGFQVQSWPVYWGRRVQTDTCNEYSSGDTECWTTGNVDVAPSKFVAVITPTLGASLQSGSNTLHIQGFANLGVEHVQAVPWGAAVTLEHIVSKPKDKEPFLGPPEEIEPQEPSEDGTEDSTEDTGGW